MPRTSSAPQKYARPTNIFKTLFRLIHYFGKKKYILIFVVILVIYTSFANIYGSIMLGQVIDNAIKAEDYNGLLVSTLTLIGIYGAGALCDLAYTQIMVRLSQTVLYNLRKELSIHNQNLVQKIKCLCFIFVQIFKTPKLRRIQEIQKIRDFFVI